MTENQDDGFDERRTTDQFSSDQQFAGPGIVVRVDCGRNDAQGKHENPLEPVHDRQENYSCRDLKRIREP